jgi:hypothetical protein
LLRTGRARPRLLSETGDQVGEFARLERRDRTGHYWISRTGDSIRTGSDFVTSNELASPTPWSAPAQRPSSIFLTKRFGRDANIHPADRRRWEKIVAIQRPPRPGRSSITSAEPAVEESWRVATIGAGKGSSGKAQGVRSRNLVLAPRRLGVILAYGEENQRYVEIRDDRTLDTLEIALQALRVVHGRAAFCRPRGGPSTSTGDHPAHPRRIFVR